MVRALALSAVDRGFESHWVKPKTLKFVFVASLLSRNSKNWLARNQDRNQDNVSEWSDMSIP